MESKRKLETIPIILLTIILSIVAVLSILIAIKVYAKAQDKVSDNRANRIGANYILTKLIILQF